VPVRFAPEWGSMHTILRFLLPIVLFAAGLVFAACMLAVTVLLLAFWSVRAAWLRLTGRPVAPFVTRFKPRQGHRAPAGGDVVDVEAKRLS
jgi:hypothetical protein